jgi:hypothetical protein
MCNNGERHTTHKHKYLRRNAENSAHSVQHYLIPEARKCDHGPLSWDGIDLTGAGYTYTHIKIYSCLRFSIVIGLDVQFVKDTKLLSQA